MICLRGAEGSRPRRHVPPRDRAGWIEVGDGAVMPVAIGVPEPTHVGIKRAHLALARLREDHANSGEITAVTDHDAEEEFGAPPLARRLERRRTGQEVEGEA